MARLLTKAFVLGCGLAVGAGVSARSGTFQVLYAFRGGSDGASPGAGLTKAGGLLYGTTLYGGSGSCFNGLGCGTVFSIDPVTRTEKIVYSFSGGKDGFTPTGRLVRLGDKLYGTANYGGANSGGTAFKLNPATGKLKVLHAFNASSTDGSQPGAGLIEAGGLLYGTAYRGGTANEGTVFSIDPATGTEQTVHAFNQNNNDGAFPVGALVDIGGVLYGVTSSGGNGGLYGTIFALNPATGAEQVVYAFKGGADGANPSGRLRDIGGTLFGVTANGGAGGHGTVFTFNPTTGAELVLHAFPTRNNDAPQGSAPTDGVTPFHGRAWGAAFFGGPPGCEAGCGVVFSLNRVSGGEIVEHSLQKASDGAGPNGDLQNVGGTLYGTAQVGGTGNAGTVFAITP